MQISTGTILLFMALTPGLFFLIGLSSSQRFLTAKDIFSSQIHELLLLLVVSAFSCLFVLGGASYFLPEQVGSFLSALHILEGSPLQEEGLLQTLFAIPIVKDSMSVPQAIFEVLWRLTVFAAISYYIAYRLGKFYPRLHFKTGLFDCKEPHPNDDLKKFLYLVRSSEYVFAWICTKTSHNGKHLIYQGMVKDVKFENDNIKHILINYPAKTYMDFESFLTTTHKEKEKDVEKLPRKLLPAATSLGTFLYIPADSIANICLQKLPGTKS